MSIGKKYDPIVSTPDDTQVSESKNTRTVYVRAEGIVAFGNGLFGIEIPVRQLEKDEFEMIHRLFPHTYSEVEAALSTEALLSAQEGDPVNLPEKPVVRLDLKGNVNAARY